VVGVSDKAPCVQLPEEDEEPMGEAAELQRDMFMWDMCGATPELG
jgi:hypothetical protein